MLFHSLTISTLPTSQGVLFPSWFGSFPTHSPKGVAPAYPRYTINCSSCCHAAIKSRKCAMAKNTFYGVVVTQKHAGCTQCKYKAINIRQMCTGISKYRFMSNKSWLQLKFLRSARMVSSCLMKLKSFMVFKAVA